MQYTNFSPTTSCIMRCRCELWNFSLFCGRSFSVLSIVCHGGGGVQAALRFFAIADDRDTWCARARGGCGVPGAGVSFIVHKKLYISQIRM